MAVIYSCYFVQDCGIAVGTAFDIVADEGVDLDLSLSGYFDFCVAAELVVVVEVAFFAFCGYAVTKTSLSESESGCSGHGVGGCDGGDGAEEVAGCNRVAPGAGLPDLNNYRRQKRRRRRRPRHQIGARAILEAIKTNPNLRLQLFLFQQREQCQEVIQIHYHIRQKRHKQH